MELGARVIDLEDDDPTTGIVIRIPEGKTISDWTFSRDGETVSAADDNPDYSADAQLVNVTFTDYLGQWWPEWTEADPEEYWEGVRENDIKVYAFPPGRLGRLDLPPALDPVVERLEGSVEELEWDPHAGGLCFEKLGEQYTITRRGTVRGEGAYVDRFQRIVDDTADETALASV
jgi:hypothetical protein